MLILFYTLLAATPQWELNTSIAYVYNAQYDGSNGVWCASSGGVFHYTEESGIDTVFSCPENLPTPDCIDVLLDSSSRLWIATRGSGLVMKDGNVWTNYSSFEGIPGQGIVYSLEEAGGSIWIGCKGGFASGDSDGFVPITAPGVFNPEHVFSLAVRNDTLWLCTDRGIYSLHEIQSPFSPASWTHWRETQDLQLNRVRTGESSVYACGGSGAVELSAGSDSFQLIIDYTSIADSVIVDIRETSQGLLAAGHGEIFYRDGTNWPVLAPGLPSVRWPTTIFEIGNDVFCGFSFVASVGDLINTQTGYGFYKLYWGHWVHSMLPGMQCKKTHQMASCEDGRLYVGTYARGVQAFYPGYGWRSFVEQDGMPSSFQTFSVAVDPFAGVWTSSYHNGLSWIQDHGTFDSQGDTILTFVKDSLELDSPQATFIRADLPNNQPVMMAAQNNGVWAAFRQYDPSTQPDEPSGILGFNGDPMGTMNWAPRLGGEGLASSNVRAVYPVSQDSLWIAFETGAGCQLLVHSGNPSDDSQDSWFPGTSAAYTTSHGLPSSEVFCFLDVPGTGLLVGTAEGLAVWTGSGFAPYQTITGQVKAMSMDSRGRIWCLSESGVYRISDGQVSLFDDLNSDFVSSPFYLWEYSALDQVNGGVYFSSEEGLWLVTQGGGGNYSSEDVSFYPQPFVSGTDLLRLCGPDDTYPVTVDFFGLDGSHAGTVEAESISNWTWDGYLDGNILASGVYMVLVNVNGAVHQARVSVIR